MITVILSTYNGANRLMPVLNSFSNVDGLSNIDFELLIIDNGSTDETYAIISKFQQNFVWARYIYEGNSGLNNARNRGILEANGEILIFIDDDLEFVKTWLLAFDELFINHPNALLAGGKLTSVVPHGVQIPSWLAIEGDNSFPYITVSVDHGDKVKSIPLATDSMPVGANMAIRKTVFEQYGLFRADLGLKGNSLMPGAEYEFFMRLAQSNIDWHYVPLAQVFHPIKTSQISQSYFLKRTYGVGRVAAKTMTLSNDTRKIGTMPLFCISLFFEAVIKYFLSLPRSNPQKSFYCKAQIYKVLGMIREWVRPRTC